MQNIWNIERNHLKVDKVKAEHLVHLNYNIDCPSFDSGKELTKVAKMEKECKFKM
jgi:hypothetical protein